MMRSKKPVTEDLLLVDVKPQSFSDEFRRFRDDHDLMYLKGCRREVLLGHGGAIDHIPELHEDVTVYTGKEAYRHMLTYVTGLISRTRGESQIVSQFKGAYREWEDRAPVIAGSFDRLYRHIIHDNGLIRNNVTSSLKPAFFEACAHELSQQGRLDTVLIVANSDRSGKNPDSLTENIMRYLGNNSKKAAQKIVFTHPDSKTLDNIYSYFLRQKVKGKLHGEIQKLPFLEAINASGDLQWMNRVYVCLPMGKDPDIDHIILEQWRQKEVYGGTLVHLGGSKKTDRLSTGAWREHALFNYVAPEDITRWQGTRKSQNAVLIAQGKKACAVCADMRESNKRPNQRALKR